MKEKIEDLEKKLIISNQLILEKKYEEAKQLLNDYLDIALKNWKQEENTKHYSFKDITEFYCAKFILKSDKDIIWEKNRIDNAYKLLSYIAILEEKYDLAREYLKLSLNYNPMNVGSRFEIAETYKKEKNFKEMLNIANKTYPYIIDINSLANYYRILGYYYIEVKQYKLAYSLYAISLYYINDENAKREIAYIKYLLNNQNFKLNTKEIIETLKENNIPLSIKQENLSLLIELLSDEKETNKANKDLINYLFYTSKKLATPIDTDKEIDGVEIKKATINTQSKLKKDIKISEIDKKRATKNIKILKNMKLPYDENQSLIPLNSIVKLKSVDEILKEAIITFSIATIVSYARENKYEEIQNVITNLDMKLEFIKLLSQDDIKLMSDIYSKKIPIETLENLIWLYEESATYFWVLGIIDKPNINKEYDINKINKVLTKCGSYNDVLKKCNLKSFEEIMDFADLTYRYDYAILKLNEENIYTKLLHPIIITRQIRAINYILSFNINDLFEDDINVNVLKDDINFSFKINKDMKFKEFDNIKYQNQIFELESINGILKLIDGGKILENEFLKEYLEEIKYNVDKGFNIIKKYEIKTPNLKTNVNCIIGEINILKKKIVIVKYFFLLNSHFVNIEVNIKEDDIKNYKNSLIDKTVIKILKSINEIN